MEDHQPPDSLASGSSSMAQILARLEAIEAKLIYQESLLERVAHLEDMLLLVTDINRYQKLQAFLEAGDLEAADTETVNVILQEAGESSRENLTPDAVKRFPCSVLQVIDQLWLKYTGGRFGFSIQLRQYQEAGGTIDSAIAQDSEMLRRLGDQVGWRENGAWKTLDQARYLVEDPVGCYPVVWWDSPYGAKMVNFFLIRLFTCDL
ncbi:hypothetical protein C7271_09715 [filamentous cyanobacterium CCP5]|nr:hypothetical protein C7271_09715 [filamentous cyanobacterium CCP5]